MLIAEEFLLLALKEESGRRRLGSDSLKPALGGALLAELALGERIGVTPASDGWNRRGRVTITSLTPTDDPELDAALQHLARFEGRKVKDFVSGSSGKRLTKGLVPRLLHRLAKAGVLTEQKGRILGVIPRTTWPVRDRAAEDEIRQRLQAALVTGLTPTERTVTLIALLEVTRLLAKVVVTDDK